ncbi:hypothetical protein SELMODRAFT_430704 [Selaginella moellendorffii]|uniref:Uncharacterized protein n=1 Tax=Selaginella moellendorffii TaxID=88036 RepID=D8TA82_SELML|nr:hypothetical protein SELMODRAFT_430704 [Selaginella moellendorffii]
MLQDVKSMEFALSKAEEQLYEHWKLRIRECHAETEATKKLEARDYRVQAGICGSEDCGFGKDSQVRSQERRHIEKHLISQKNDQAILEMKRHEINKLQGSHKQALKLASVKQEEVQSLCNCLFRPVADQVYGDPEMFGETRQMCINCMERKRDHFSQFITEGFTVLQRVLCALSRTGPPTSASASRPCHDGRSELRLWMADMQMPAALTPYSELRQVICDVFLPGRGSLSRVTISWLWGTKESFPRAHFPPLLRTKSSKMINLVAPVAYSARTETLKRLRLTNSIPPACFMSWSAIFRNNTATDVKLNPEICTREAWETPEVRTDEAALNDDAVDRIAVAPIVSKKVEVEVLESWRKRRFQHANDASMDHVCIHPKFLHSNATSHKWALGAIAELLDNALDEAPHGATFVNINVLKNPVDGSPMLLFEGITQDRLRECMSFGYTEKDKDNCMIG